jgi:hypothetical protein
MRKRKEITYEIDENGCWNCISHAKNIKGYPHLIRNGKQWIMSRYIYTQIHGQIPDGMYVCHKCDNPSCINPEHLFLGTQTDNMQDMVNKGRQLCGSLNGNSKLTAIEAKEIKYSALSGVNLAKMFNVSTTQVSDIKNGKRWKHI